MACHCLRNRSPSCARVLQGPPARLPVPPSERGRPAAAAWCRPAGLRGGGRGGVRGGSRRHHGGVRGRRHCVRTAPPPPPPRGTNADAATLPHICTGEYTFSGAAWTPTAPPPRRRRHRHRGHVQRRQQRQLHRPQRPRLRGHLRARGLRSTPVATYWDRGATWISTQSRSTRRRRPAPTSPFSPTSQGGVREPLPPRSGRVRHEHRRHRRRPAAVRCRGLPDAVRGRVRVHGEQCCRSVAPSIIPPGIWRRITFGISRSVAMRGDVSGASKRPGSNHNAAAGSKYSNRILCAEARTPKQIGGSKKSVQGYTCDPYAA